MYNKILSEISQEYYQQNYPNDGQRFVAWYLRNMQDGQVVAQAVGARPKSAILAML